MTVIARDQSEPYPSDRHKIATDCALLWDGHKIFMGKTGLPILHNDNFYQKLVISTTLAHKKRSSGLGMLICARESLKFSH